MPCEIYPPNLVICRPTLQGMGTAREAWCFNCRRRMRHWLFLTNDQWYDPEPVWKCDGCWGDHTVFPYA